VLCGCITFMSKPVTHTGRSVLLKKKSTDLIPKRVVTGISHTVSSLQTWLKTDNTFHHHIRRILPPGLYTGFTQKSDCGFPDFSRTKLLLSPDFSEHFVHLYVNKKITKLAFKCWNFLYNEFFYSKYWMALKFLNFSSDALCHELQEN